MMFWCGSRVSINELKVAEDDIAFKLAILKKSLHFNDNTCFCSIIQSSKLVLGSLLAKNYFFVQFWTKNFASSRMANCGSGLPAEWPFRSQNAIEASESPLPGGLWVKRLITHASCSLAYSDIAWCKLFLIFTMKCLYWVFFAYKTPYSVLIDNSIHIQEIDTEKTWLTLQGQIFRCIKHLSVSQLKYFYSRIGQIFSIKVVTEAQVNLWHFTGVFSKSMYCFTNLILSQIPKGPRLLTRMKFSPSMDNRLRRLWNVGSNYLSIPKLRRCNLRSVDMDK